MALCLTTFHEYNFQEVFEFVVNKLFEQNAPSVQYNKDGNPPMECLFRTKDKKGNTLKCAIGHLISDEEYSSAMEGADLEEVYDMALENVGQERRRLHHSELDFLVALQCAHDYVAEYPGNSKDFADLLARELEVHEILHPYWARMKGTNE